MSAFICEVRPYIASARVAGLTTNSSVALPPAGSRAATAAPGRCGERGVTYGLEWDYSALFNRKY